MLDSLTMSAVDSVLEEGGLNLTLDTAKVYKNDKLDRPVFEYMMARNEHIRELHINDVIPNLGSHQIFGTGMVNFIPYLKLTARRDIWLTFEVRPVSAAAESKNRFLRLPLGEAVAAGD